jgi:acyl dehydratase
VFYEDIEVGATIRVGGEATWVAKRQSESKPDRGIITAFMKLVNQKDEVVLSHTGTMFMHLRNLP